MKKNILFIVLIMALLQATNVFAEKDLSIKHNNIKINQESLVVNVNYPYFEGYAGSDQLNEKIRSMIADSVGDAISTADTIYNDSAEIDFKPMISLEISYEYELYDNLISVQLYTDYYAGGAHPTHWVNSFLLDTKTGEFVNFNNLFKEDANYTEVIENKILAQIDKEKDKYFEDYEQAIKDKGNDLNFIITGDLIIVYFDLYEIAPYVSGMPVFIFKAEEIKPILRTEIYDNINGADVNSGEVSYNGINIDSKNKLLYTDVAMLPLRDTADALGYDVGWSREAGAMVAGGYIKNGVNSYGTSEKLPVKLIAPVVVNGVTYVPLQYFTEVLEENVNFGYGMLGDYNTVVRIYGKSNKNNFDNLIKEFKSATTAEEAVTMYAEAVKMRNGAVQFGLMSDELRKENYANLSDLNFVTGSSSPWVDSYEIVRNKENNYEIKYNLRTSEPNDEIQEISNILLAQDEMFWKITKLEK